MRWAPGWRERSTSSRAASKRGFAMRATSFNLASAGLGGSNADELVKRKADAETPEFDITAMVDLVFMMNIYFLVTFVTLALAEVDLPAAAHVAPLDGDSSVLVTLVSGGDHHPAVIYIGDREKGERIGNRDQIEDRVRAAVEKGAADGKTDVLLKAEKNVRLADLFRVSAAASSVEGMKMNVAVMEKSEP
jgi:biopolymer transport protein ExbD